MVDVMRLFVFDGGCCIMLLFGLFVVSVKFVNELMIRLINNSSMAFSGFFVYISA